MNKKVVSLNYNEIKKHQSDLEKYDGLLPLVLMSYIRNHKYIQHLKDKGIFEDVQEQIFKRRTKYYYLSDEESILFEEKELKKWLKNNEEYNYIISDING